MFSSSFFLNFMQIGHFPADCMHAAVVELVDGTHHVHTDIEDCCRNKCDFPEFLGCMWGVNRKPYWVCAGRVHQCISDCRKKYTETTKRRGKLSTSVCRKTTCNKYRRGQCCIENKCIRLYVHRTKSPVQP